MISNQGALKSTKMCARGRKPGSLSLSGVQNAGKSITFSDGTSQSVDIPNPGFDGGTTFVGFTDAGKSIASITINVHNDVVGVDDVRYVADPLRRPW